MYDRIHLRSVVSHEGLNCGQALGYPFRLVIDYGRFDYVFCKSTPVPGEQAIPDPKSVVGLPQACRAE